MPVCDCDRALELLSFRLDGALSREEASELAEHLNSCEVCRAANRELEAIHAVMPELLEEVPEGFHQKVMEKIAGEKVVTFPVKKAHTAWKSWAPLAAVFAVILLGAGTLSHLGAKSGSPMAPPAALAAVPMETPVGDTGGFGAAASADSQAKDATNGGENAAKTQADEGGIAPQAAGIPAPQPTALPESAAQPRAFAMSAVLTPQEAGAAAAELEYPGVTAADLSREDGSYGGWTAVLSDGSAVELRYLGPSPNEEYYEFGLYDQGSDQERNRLAVKLDGSAIETFDQLGQEAYDTLVGTNR
ncbi:MAG: hypothetical protein EOM52_11595 [Clostridia bacterium]|nr:hypothetical protein [Clostridia bacterium]